MKTDPLQEFVTDALEGDGTNRSFHIELEEYNILKYMKWVTCVKVIEHSEDPGFMPYTCTWTNEFHEVIKIF